MARANTQTSAKWTVNENTLDTTVGVSTGSAVVELEITNIVNGVNTGHLLAASNFKVGNGNDSGSNTWTDTSPAGWNADAGVQSVQFIDNGTALDPNNTIKVRIVTTNTSITSSNKDKTIYIDIDETENTVNTLTRKACIETKYIYYANHTVAVTDITDITETTLLSGAGTTYNWNSNSHSGAVAEQVSTKIAEITFTADSGYYYHGAPTLFFNNLSPYYDNAYVGQLQNLVTNSSGLATKFVARVFYTPPTTGPAAVDPESFCLENHEAIIDMALRPVPSDAAGMAPVGEGGGGVVQSLTFGDLVATEGGYSRLEVLASPNTQFNVKVQKMTTISSTSVASSGGHYNFTDALFQDSADSNTTYTATADSKGRYVEYISIPSVTASTSYCILISSSNSSTLDSSIPDALGEARILQYGNATLTLTPVKTGDGNFGTMPSSFTITKPSSSVLSNTSVGNASRYEVGGYSSKGYPCEAKGSTQVRGSAKGASSTRLVLNDKKKIRQIRPGMLVIGSNVDFGTTVSHVRRKDGVVILSSAQEIADNTDLTFKRQGNLRSFSFTIPPAEGNTLSVNSSGTVEGALDKILNTPQSITRTTVGTVSNSTTINLTDATGIAVGMAVSGTGISGSPTVASLVDEDTITLSVAQTLSSDGVGLTFTGGIGGVSMYNPTVKKVGSNIVISGYLKCESLEDDITCNLTVNSLITVS